MNNEILVGIDDIPTIAQDKCFFCDGDIPENPWFVFHISNGQTYLVPECDDCENKNSPEGQRIEQ